MCYTDVPKESEANIFKAFANKFKWPNNQDHEVYRVFCNIASIRIRDTLHEARESAIKESHSNNPIDWRPYKPVWIDDCDWIKLIEYWNTEEWQKKSKINSKNRASTAKGEQPKHTAGSVSYAVVEDRMTEELGRRPTPLELLYGHTLQNLEIL